MVRVRGLRRAERGASGRSGQSGWGSGRASARYGGGWSRGRAGVSGLVGMRARTRLLEAADPRERGGAGRLHEDFVWT